MWVVFLILGIVCIGIYVFTTVLNQQRSDELGVNALKVLKEGRWVEEVAPLEGGLVRFEPAPLADYSAADSPSLLDGLRSRVGSSIQKHILENETKVINARATVVKAQREVVDQKIALVKAASEGQRARDEYELLPEERRVKELGYEVSRSELELKKQKLELERRKLTQQLQGGQEDEPEDLAPLREARQSKARAQMQSYMDVTENDSLIARLQALDAWYDEKTEEIMADRRLSVERRRGQLDLLKGEYELRKKQLRGALKAAKKPNESGIGV